MDSQRPSLLLVDDDPLIRDTLGFLLAEHFVVRTAASRPEAIAQATSVEFQPQLALVDLGLPPTPHRPDEGFRLVVELSAIVPGIKIIVLSGQSSKDNARHARTLGAIEFIDKPVAPEALLKTLHTALDWRAAEQEVGQQLEVAGLIGQSPHMERLRRQVHQFATAPFPILIVGESGSGKEAVAKALHVQSNHAAAPYLALNCAALAENLIEATLFGYAKGAFTGASAARAGYFEEVGEGTLFLDEIGELPLPLQAKLLRVLENGEFQRLGETSTRVSRARVVAATNRDLRRLAREGTFRADLYHRLSVLSVETPPLRELGDDRWLLLDHFTRVYAQQLGMQPFQLGEAAREAWNRYSFPGNVRELRNVAIRLLAKHAGQLVSPLALTAEFDADADTTPIAAPISSHRGAGRPDPATATATLREATDFHLDTWLAAWEQAYIDAALNLADGNMTQAARLLGVNRTTLYSRLDSRRDKH
ncbi:MAG: sigma-54-dependent Fis family transcriptional regulator [Burkholderiales bacterium]|nr:sigma-54-dependent Fis family transcriptional regulator [Burkholderiales bacterium]